MNSPLPMETVYFKLLPKSVKSQLRKTMLKLRFLSQKRSMSLIQRSLSPTPPSTTERTIFNSRVMVKPNQDILLRDTQDQSKFILLIHLSTQILAT